MVNETRSTLTDLYHLIISGKEMTDISLPQFTRTSNIVSNMYIEQNIAQDEIAVPLSQLLDQLYCGFVLTALSLNQFIGGGKTVRGVIASVSSEAHIDVAEIVRKEFGKEEPSCEASNPIVEMDKQTSRLAAGKVIAFDLSVPNSDGKNSSITIYLHCQIIPRIITQLTAEAIITSNRPPTFQERLNALRAGEIKFFQDFIMCRDLIANEAKALKEDKTNILYDILNDNKNKLAKQLVGIVVGEQRHNLSNTIMVFSSATFKVACNTARMNFENYGARQKFFARTGVMMFVVVDPMYSTVDIYFNGLQHKGTYDYNTITATGSGKKDPDMKQMLSLLGSGMAPRF